MNDTKYQVFISSTYLDLVTERESIIKAILELHHIPIGMEMFSAEDEDQWEIIRRKLFGNIRSITHIRRIRLLKCFTIIV